MKLSNFRPEQLTRTMQCLFQKGSIPGCVDMMLKILMMIDAMTHIAIPMGNAIASICLASIPCLPSFKGSRSSVILNEYPSPMKRTRRLQTANTLMVTGQIETEGTRDSGLGSRHHGTLRSEPD